jgi:hypothetical protein
MATRVTSSLKLDSDSLSKGGVYVIWSEDADGSRKAAVYVGQGKPVAECLARHRDEATITQHERNGRVLRATWAKVRKEERGGVERYLEDTLRPLEGDRWSGDSPFPSTFLGESKTRQQTQPVCDLCSDREAVSPPRGRLLRGKVCHNRLHGGLWQRLQICSLSWENSLRLTISPVSGDRRGYCQAMPRVSAFYGVVIYVLEPA